METGLTTSQVKSRLAKFGYNEIPQKKEYKALKILISQFTSFLIIILIAAGVLSLLLHETVDGIAILAIVFINAIIGFFQEYKAENAVAALKKMVIPTTIVIRNGKKQELPIRELVPDDIIILSEGDKVPADCELVEAFSLKVDESMLTGESVPADKNTDDSNKAFKGTIVVSGRATAKVTGTGADTEFGKIIALVSKEEKTKSPLALQLDHLGKKIGLIVLILVGILYVVGLLRGVDWIEMFMTAIALGVAAIPEGMPIIVTLTLALGVQVLARKKAIVRKMNSVETLGATTIICSDKTGTLTLNEMTVKKVFADFQEHDIPGEGYQIKKHVTLKGTALQKLLEICENCNNSDIQGRKVLGDPTEIALKILTRKAKYVKEYKELDENVFTSERKMMSSLHKVGSKKELMAKGAYEEILKKCTHIIKGGKTIKLTPTHKKEIKKTADSYAKQALRVLGFAYKTSSTISESKMIFVGLVGMIDPPRPSVKHSIEIAQKAHIQVRIITGDNPITARAIGEQIGIKVTNVKTGDQIAKMSDRELRQAIKTTQIFARVKPQDKYRIVNILKKAHHVVAVTGDGVNDAPALKHADVGVAMGIKGTEATKEVADIVLKDDNFTTIVNTIKEGRRIYSNILSFIKFMLSANYDTIMAVGVLTIMGFPLPILPLQILWINIATDALPALALGNSPAAPDIMEEKPHPKKENIFKKFFLFITVAALSQTIINIAVYFYGAHLDAQLGVDLADLSQPSHARTMVFTQIVMFEMFFVFLCKDERLKSVKQFFNNKYLLGAVLISFSLQILMVYAPFMQEIFTTVPIKLDEWLLIAALSSSAFLVPGITNFIKKFTR